MLQICSTTTHLIQNKLEDAISVYSEITKNSDNPEIFVNLAIAQGQMKNYDEALNTLNNAKTKFPTSTQVDDAIKNIKNETIAATFDKAAEYFNNKDYPNAINEYGKIQPPTSDSMLGIASAYQNLGDNGKAIEYYQKAFQLKPDDSDIAYYIGVLYGEEENYAAAEEFLKKSVELNKNNQKAAEYLKSIVEQNNANSLNEAIALYDGEKYDESLKLLNKLLIAEPMNAYAYYYRGMIYDAKNNQAEAVNNFKNVLKYNNSEDLIIVNYLIAADLDTLGKYKEAYPYYKKYADSNAPDDEYKKYAAARLEELKQYAQ